MIAISPTRFRLAAALFAVLVVAPPATAATQPVPRAGKVVSSTQLDRRLWVPGTTGAAYLLQYRTADAFGRPAVSSGVVFLPDGKSPRGGWPVMSWAHGTVGLGDSCAPSRTGRSQRDLEYLAHWMRQGYAVVASDFVGLGTPGLAPYLDGMTTAHSVVDVVKAARSFASARLPRTRRLSQRWVAIGQSQGAGAAIYTGRYASALGGRKLDFRGAVGTGTPAYTEALLVAMGPKAPPVQITPASTRAIAYTLAGLRYARPQLNINAILSDAGRKYVDLAETACIAEFTEMLKGVAIGDLFSKPVASIPNVLPVLREYMGMPEDGFDRPFFIAHGLADTNVPIAGAAQYSSVLRANQEPGTFKPYASDHSGTMAASLPDTTPFVHDLFHKP